MGHIKNLIGVAPEELRIGDVRINTGITGDTIDAITIANTDGVVENVQIPNSPFVIGKADVATSSGSTNALDSSRSFIKLTGSTFFNVYGINEGITGQQLTILNGSTNLVLFHHDQDVGNDKIYLQNGSQKVLTPGSSAFFIYDGVWNCISIQNNVYDFVPTATDSSSDTILYDIYLYQNGVYNIKFPKPTDVSKTVYAFLHLPEEMTVGDYIDVSMDIDILTGRGIPAIITGIYQTYGDHLIIDGDSCNLAYFVPQSSTTKIAQFAGNNVVHNSDPSDYITKLYQTISTFNDQEFGISCPSKQKSRYRLVCIESNYIWKLEEGQKQYVEKDNTFYSTITYDATKLNNMKMGALVYPSYNASYENKGIRYIGPNYSSVDSVMKCSILKPFPQTSIETLTVSEDTSYHPFKVIFSKKYERYYLLYYHASGIKLEARRSQDDSVIETLTSSEITSVTNMRYDYLSDNLKIFGTYSGATKVMSLSASDITSFIVMTSTNVYPRDMAIFNGVPFYAFQTSNIISNNDSYDFPATTPRRILYVPLNKGVYNFNADTSTVEVIPTSQQNIAGIGRGYSLACTAPHEAIYVPRKRMIYINANAGLYKLDPITNKISSWLDLVLGDTYQGSIGYLPWYDVVFCSSSVRSIKFIN